MITFKKGPVENETVFHIPKALLAQYSGHFRNDMTSVFATEEPQDIQVVVFGIFVDWLYKQALPGVSDWCTHYEADDAETSLLELFILSHRYDIPELEIYLLGAAVNYYNIAQRAPSVALVSKALGFLPDNNKYLDLLADAFCLFWSKENEAELEQSPTLGCLGKVAMRFLKSFDRFRWRYNLQFDDYVK